MSNKTLEQQIRLVMEQQANAGVLEYGSDIARDTYAKDTPGQTPGVDHNPVQHQHKPNLALDGVPVPGGQLKKPNFEKDAGMGKVAEAKDMKVKNCGCGKDPCETYGSKEEQMKEAFDSIGKSGKHDVHFTDTSDYNYKSRHASKVSHGGKGSDEAREDQFHYKFKDHKIDVNDNQNKTKLSHVQQRVKASGVDPKHHDAVSKSIHKHITAESVEIDEAGRWDQTSQGKAYRRLSPEEKARKAKANQVMRAAKGMKGKAKAAKQGIGKLKAVYKGTRLQRNDVMSDLIADLEMAYLGEAMSDSERKQAAAKIFRMHQAKQAAKQANAALGKKSDPAAKAARRDSAGYKTSDDSHLDTKPKAPEKKRGRGERDLPHIVSQLRGVVDTKDGKPSAVKFKDGTTKNVKPKHAAAWLKKHDSAKPQQKLDMYKSHDSHSSFKSYAKEAVDKDDTKGLKKLVKGLKGSSKAHLGQAKELDKLINDEYIPEGSKPNNPKLWAAKKAAAKAKFDVYPSAYANGWAAKQYKAAGGTWRSESVEHDLNELSSKTYKDYIRKAASPVNKPSAINLASKGGFKLGRSDSSDLDAGEKEDRKAYNRGRGIQRAAKKLYGRTNESSSWLQQTADTWNDHADHKDPKVQKHIKKAEKAYNNQDYDNFHRHTNNAATHAYNLKKKANESVMGKYKELKKKAKNVANSLNNINRSSYSNVKGIRREEKMAGQEYRTQMSKVKSKDPAIRKAISNIYDKKPGKDIDHPEVKAAKKYMKTEANLQELSPDLINKVAHKRNVNVYTAGRKADFDRRDPDYQKAAQKQDRNRQLRFSAGAKAARKIGQALSKSINK